MEKLPNSFELIFFDYDSLFSFCESPVIIPICTKVDTKEKVLNARICKEILSCCQELIQRSLEQTGYKKKVVLLNEIIHFSSKVNVEDQDPDDPRKNSRYLRDLVAALCDFCFKGQFFIPNSWNTIGTIYSSITLFKRKRICLSSSTLESSC